MHHALVPSPLGPCGLAWSDAGLCAVQLPEADEAATLARLASRGGERVDALPEWVGTAAARLASVLAGAGDDLADLPLDLSGISAFDARVYALARTIGPGRTSTYGALAEELGTPGAARAVGRALGANPWLVVVPCHRVLGADGGLRGFSAHGGLATKARLLAIEGGQGGLW